MNNFLQPVKILLDMKVETKSTYRAALEGLDLYMVQHLDSIGYDANKVQNIQLYKLPTNTRLAAAQARREEFEKNPGVGICDFMQYANKVFYDFLEVYHVGHVYEMYMDDNSWLNVTIACLIHKRLTDGVASGAKKFKAQIDKLTEIGMYVKQENGMSHYCIPDTETNRKQIHSLFVERDAKLFSIESSNGNISQIEFKLKPQNLCKFVETPKNFSEPITDMMNADEFAKMNKAIAEIYSSLAFSLESEEMLQTCCNVAENCFYDICEIAGYHGNIYSRVKSRHEDERKKNQTIYKLNDDMGSNFPVDVVEATMNKIVCNINRFCVENMQSVAHNIKIDQWGNLKADIKYIPRIEDMRYHLEYCRIIDENFHVDMPEIDSMQAVYDTIDDCAGSLYLKGTEKNFELITKFLNMIEGVHVDTIVTACNKCNAYPFIIEGTKISISNVVGILNWYERKKRQ